MSVKQDKVTAVFKAQLRQPGQSAYSVRQPAAKPLKLGQSAYSVRQPAAKPRKAK